MQHAISQEHLHNSTAENSYTDSGVISRFLHWCASQESKRFMWVGITLMGLIGTVVPLTMLAILFFANGNFYLIMAVCAANVTVFALNLAAQPPKVTLPALFAAAAVDVAIILLCAIMYLL